MPETVPCAGNVARHDGVGGGFPTWSLGVCVNSNRSSQLSTSCFTWRPLLRFSHNRSSTQTFIFL
jgi:hypothetical protein